MLQRDEASIVVSPGAGRAALGAPPNRQGVCLRCCQATCHLGLEAVVGVSAVATEKQSPALSVEGVPA